MFLQVNLLNSLKSSDTTVGFFCADTLSTICSTIVEHNPRLPEPDNADGGHLPTRQQWVQYGRAAYAPAALTGNEATARGNATRGL